MSVPVLFARIENQYDFAAIRINGRQIRTFEQVATRAGQSEILRAVVAVVLFGSNMLDLECGDESRLLGKPAIFAAVTCALPDQPPGACVH